MQHKCSTNAHILHLSAWLCLCTSQAFVQVHRYNSENPITSSNGWSNVGREIQLLQTQAARNDYGVEENDGGDLDALEKEVLASAKVKLDLDRVTNTLKAETTNRDRANDASKVALLSSPWQVAISAATIVSILILSTTRSLELAALCFVGVFVVGNKDPLADDGLAGPVTRLLGRFAIQSVESSKPRLIAVARAAITDEEELAMMKEELEQLRHENEELQLWKSRRIAVDNVMKKYQLSDLKETARRNGISIGGTKSQLLMRLVEEGIIDL